MGLTFDGEADTLDDVIGYTDFDFGKSKTDQKSTGGYVFILAKAAISHLSKLQSIVALSTCEAEYVAICKARKEAVWLRYLLVELGFWRSSTQISLYADNQGPIALLNNPKFYCQIKHINIRSHWICKTVSMKQLKIIYIPTAEMVVKSLTKDLPTLGFLQFRHMIAM